MQQRGFTLLELMVAMAIFAVLAVAGWQVFDSVNRARERAQFHADQLATLQYAYLQIQQDMAQMVPYHSLMAQAGNNDNLNNSANNSSPTNSNNNNVTTIIPEPFMSLNGEQLSFIRFADSDPRYKISPSLQRVTYIFLDEKLIRRQYITINGGENGVSLDSVVLEGVTAGRWQAFLPEISATFPNKNSDTQTNNPLIAQAENATHKPPMLLPIGIGVSFTYQELPITWHWALAPQAISLIHPTNSGENTNNNNANGHNSKNDTNGNDNNNNSNEVK